MKINNILNEKQAAGQMKEQVRKYAIIALGSVLYSLAFDWFFAANTVAMGGVTGLAQIIHYLCPPLSVGVLVFAMNIPLFLAGWKFIGWHLLISSLFSTAVSSAAIDLIAMIHTFEPMDPMLAAVCGGAMLGLGLGIVFSQGATTGGTDIAARLLELKFPWLPMGKLKLVPDGVVLVLAAITFGQVETVLYGIVSLFIATRLMDTVLYGLDTSKVAYVITDRWREVADTLMEEQNHGVTFLRGEGAYTGQEKRVLMIAFKQKEIVQIKTIVHRIDANAFLIVCDAHEVLGEGFGDYQKEAI